MREIVFAAKDVTKRYKNTVALKHVSMEVKKGDIYGFIGENGAGKTTMIRILTGLAFPSSGEISLFGKVGNDLSKERKK
ncbi:MAG: ATP-binding cassette domain-containing protein [Mediterraneibacter faecis]